MTDEIQVWRNNDAIDHLGPWATTRYPAEAVTYIRKADAQAAVALVVERFAHECEQNATYYLGRGEPRKRAAFLHAAKEARQLAPADGLAMVEALRTALRVANENTVAFWNERDRLTADLAAARAQIEALRGAPFPDETGFYGLIGDAMREAEKAMRKFPQPNYVISKVAEEAGEVVKAAIHCAEGRETAENLRGEMKQLIAMLYRLWVEGDGVHGLPSVRAALAALPAKEG